MLAKPWARVTSPFLIKQLQKARFPCGRPSVNVRVVIAYGTEAVISWTDDERAWDHWRRDNGWHRVGTYLSQKEAKQAAERSRNKHHDGVAQWNFPVLPALWG